MKSRLAISQASPRRLIRSTILTSVGYDPDASPDRVRVTMGGGTTVCPRVVLNRLTALGQHRIGFPVLSHTLPPDAGVAGLLGLDFLRGAILTVDFRNGRISLA